MNDIPATLTDVAIAGLLVDTEPYLSCDDCFERIDEYVERRLAAPSHVDPRMETHLAGCGACAEEARALEELLRQDAE
jgi:hypothetical protein